MRTDSAEHETRQAVRDGATETGMAINSGAPKARDRAPIRRSTKTSAKTSARFNDEEKVMACQLAEEAGAGTAIVKGATRARQATHA